MKKYHVQNYVRYKHDMAAALNRLPDWPYQELSRDQLITKFLPLVESLSMKFSTAQSASGVMSIMDLLQEGNYGLCAGVNRIDWDTILESIPLRIAPLILLDKKDFIVFSLSSDANIVSQSILSTAAHSP